MKKPIALLLAVLFVVALFAGCGGQNAGGNAPSNTKTPSASAPGAPQADGTASGDDDSPYCYAAGKYEKNDEGFPTAKYVYDKPLCTNDEVLTKWTTCYTPQYIPADGWGSIPTWSGVREYTGVHIEYNVVDAASRAQNFSVLVASDDLDDIVDQGAFFYQGGTTKSAIEDGYFVNLYDYIDYMPCYMYEVYTRSQNNVDVMNTVFYDDTTIPTLTGMLVEPAPGMGYFLRQDWLDEMGLGAAAEVTTYDELHKVLLAMKSAYSIDREIFPFFINNCVEVSPGAAFAGYNTCIYTSDLSYLRVKDGEVQFCGTTEDDLAAMSMLNQWFQEGLISPNFASFVAGEDYDAGVNNNGLGCHLNTPSSWATTEANSIDPDTDWEPIPRTRLYDGQILQYGNKQGNFHYGSANVTGNCENVELAVSWLDWWMSDFGSEWTSWGPEGIMWEYNEKGERRLTDWCLNHEAGMAWIMCLYGNNGLVEFCLQIHKRNYCYDGGDRALGAFDVWTIPDYGGAYDWPSAIKLSDDDRDEANSIMADLSTYYQENYVAFVDNSKPMSEWDSYIAGMNSFGYARLREIYQDAYDLYMADNA